MSASTSWPEKSPASIDGPNPQMSARSIPTLYFFPKQGCNRSEQFTLLAMKIESSASLRAIKKVLMNYSIKYNTEIFPFWPN